MTASPHLQATGLVRRFGLVRALDGVSFEVAAGELVLLLGRNGAGKTTLLRTLAGLCRPRRGVVRVLGRDVHADPAARSGLGFVSHHAMVYDDLTPRENLRFHAALHRLDDREATIRAALRDAGLEERADRPVRGFSRGMHQRLALARAGLHRPPVLLLDEPFTGLDPLAATELTQRIERWRSEARAVVVVSHDPAGLWSLATRVVVMGGGKVLVDGPHPGDLATFRRDLDRWMAE